MYRANIFFIVVSSGRADNTLYEAKTKMVHNRGAWPIVTDVAAKHLIKLLAANLTIIGQNLYITNVHRGCELNSRAAIVVSASLWTHAAV